MLNWGILNFGVKCEEVEFGYLFMVEFEGVIYIKIPLKIQD